MTDPPPSPAEGPSAPARAGRRRRWADLAWYGFLALVVLCFIYLGTVSILATRSPFCGLCHSSAYRSVRQGPHSSQSCDSCHAGANGFDLVANRLAVAAMVPRQFALGPKAQATYVGNDACMRCHGSDLLETTESNGLRMNHRKLIADEWSCTTCHATVGHGSSSVRKVGYTMDMCLPCHSTNPTNQATCQTCHLEKTQAVTERDYPTPFDATHGAGSTKNHGMGNLDTCKACHTPEQCRACHDIDVPHPSTFMGTHGSQLQDKTLSRAVCDTCHQPATCDNCHGVPMPHPAGFARDHTKLVQDKGRAVCLRCHTNESCTNCHIAHTHPGLPPDLRNTLEKNPAS